jgi:hypothetical protein
MPALKGVNPTEKRQIVERRKVSSSNLNGGRILQKNMQDVGIHIVIIVRAGRAKKYNSRCYFDYITTCHIPTVQFHIY